MILIAPGSAIGAGKFAAVILVYAIATPEPAIYELVFIEDCLKVLEGVFDHINPVIFPELPDLSILVSHPKQSTRHFLSPFDESLRQFQLPFYSN